jgi:channel protein (hemolysin III family)
MMLVDHAGIFFLIAATYTPIHVIQFKGLLRWGGLAVVWTVAISGIVLKSVFFNVIPEGVGLAVYLTLGWAGLVSATALYQAIGLKPLIPIIAGALAYTLGATLEYSWFPTLVPGVIGPHEIFHILVLVGVSMHWAYIRRIAIHAPITDFYQSR